MQTSVLGFQCGHAHCAKEIMGDHQVTHHIKCRKEEALVDVGHHHHRPSKNWNLQDKVMENVCSHELLLGVSKIKTWFDVDGGMPR